MRPLTLHLAHSIECYRHNYGVLTLTEWTVKSLPYIFIIIILATQGTQPSLCPTLVTRMSCPPSCSVICIPCMDTLHFQHYQDILVVLAHTWVLCCTHTVPRVPVYNHLRVPVDTLWVTYTGWPGIRGYTREMLKSPPRETPYMNIQFGCTTGRKKKPHVFPMGIWNTCISIFHDGILEIIDLHDSIRLLWWYRIEFIWISSFFQILGHFSWC